MNTSNTPSVYFSTISNIRDNAIDNHYHLPWPEVVGLLKEQKHLQTTNKNVTCISPWKYKTIEHVDYVPRVDSSGNLWTIDDQPVVARVAANVLGTNLLMFDFDATLSTNEAKGVFGAWTHFGYTSFSHMSPNKDRKDCFRVMVPLARFVTAEQLVARRKAIYATFPGVDTSCLSLARSFFVPSCLPERINFAHMWDNQAELLDVMEYQPEIYIAPTHSAIAARDPDRDKILSALKFIYIGHEPTWFKVALAMVSNDFTLQQFIDASVSGLMREKSIKDCETKWRSAAGTFSRGSSISIGFLINLCKQHGQWNTSVCSSHEGQ